MARFDVHRNASRRSRDRVPYLLDVQADLLSSLATRLVVPLIPAGEFGSPLEKLNPQVRVGGKAYIVATAEMAAISLKDLGEKTVSLESRSADILAAVDFLISGF